MRYKRLTNTRERKNSTNEREMGLVVVGDALRNYRCGGSWGADMHLFEWASGSGYVVLGVVSLVHMTKEGYGESRLLKIISIQMLARGLISRPEARQEGRKYKHAYV